MVEHGVGGLDAGFEFQRGVVHGLQERAGRFVGFDEEPARQAADALMPLVCAPRTASADWDAVSLRVVERFHRGMGG